jgi:hypothetical protein
MDVWQQFLQSVNPYAGAIAALALLLALIAFLYVSGARARIRALTRPLSSIGRTTDEPITTIPSILAALEENQVRVDGLARGVEELYDKSRGFFQYAGLVRYDAFADIGGQQSYSLCLLDGSKDGFLVTYLTGRNSTRSYAVDIKGGVPSRKLGDEENRAMDEALAGARGDKNH